MNLRQLEAFVHVADGKSFSKAAKDLFLTQPTISAHIAALEKELGVRVFIRNTKEVRMSDEGQKLYKYAKQMVDIEKKIVDQFGTGDQTISRGISIAASTIPSQYLLPKVMLRFRQEHPEEQLKLLEMDSAEVIEMIVGHVVDVGFTGTVLDKKHCCYIPFYKDELAVITPNTEKYQHYKRERAGDISWILEENLIMREEGSGTRKEAEKQLKAAGIDVGQIEIVATMANHETIKRSVTQGMGITILSRLVASEESDRDQFLTFPIPGADKGRAINVVYNKDYSVTKSVGKFIQTVKSTYGLEREE